MAKIIVVGTCPKTLSPLYVSDIKPGLLKRDARGDWGYSSKSEQAIGLTVSQADKAMRDLKFCGYKPQIIAA